MKSFDILKSENLMRFRLTSKINAQIHKHKSQGCIDTHFIETVYI